MRGDGSIIQAWPDGESSIAGYAVPRTVSALP